MDNGAFLSALQEGAAAMGVELGESVAAVLLRHQELLVQWNPRVNLTSVVEERASAEIHFLDSLACLAWVKEGAALLDIGSGGGFPGLPLKVAAPSLDVTLVDAVAKKVAFLKQVIVSLKLPGIRAVHARLEGAPFKEGVPVVDRITARAVGPLPRLLPMVSPYLAPQGKLVATLGTAEAGQIDREADEAGWRALELRTYALPFSGARRALALLEPKRST